MTSSQELSKWIEDNGVSFVHIDTHITDKERIAKSAMMAIRALEAGKATAYVDPVTDTIAEQAINIINASNRGETTKHFDW